MGSGQQELPLDNGNSPFQLIVLHGLHLVCGVGASHVHLQRRHLHQLVAMVEAGGEDVKNGRPGRDELLQALCQEGRPVDGRQEDGLDLVEAELVWRLVGFYEELQINVTQS